MSVNAFFIDDLASKSEQRIYARESLVYNVTEDILVLLEDLDVTKNELAKRMGKSRSYVTQVLSGARNMTLGTLSDICFALEAKPQVEVHFDKKSVRKNAEWESNAVELPAVDAIKKSENVIDRRQQDQWQNMNDNRAA